MITVLVSILAVVAMAVAFAARDEFGIIRVWIDIFTPEFRRRVVLLAQLGAEHKRVITSTRAEAREAQRAGELARAADLERCAAEHETGTKGLRQRASILRRMLSAIE